MFVFSELSRYEHECRCGDHYHFTQDDIPSDTNWFIVSCYSCSLSILVKLDVSNDKIVIVNKNDLNHTQERSNDENNDEIKMQNAS